MKILFLLLIGFLSFETGRSQGLSLPYYSGFDSGSETSGWQQFRLGNDPTANSWNVGGGGFSANCLSHDYNVGANSTDTLIDWYVSPALNFTTIASIALKVRTGGFSAPTPDNCEVYFGMDDPDPATGNFVLIGTLSYMLPQYTWLDTTLAISFTSDSGYVAFKYKTIGAAWMTYLIDNINITSVSSVNENTPSYSFSVFPNPMGNTSTLLLDSHLDLQHTEISITDISGREVKRISFPGQYEVILTKDQLASGTYVVHITQKGVEMGAQKLVVF